MKTSELIDQALDWAVAKCESLCLGEDLFGLKPIIAAPVFTQRFKPSTDWAQGGPIIERERIELRCWDFHSKPWRAEIAGSDSELAEYGPTPLIAAMRAYVASKLGDEVEIPEELL